MHTGRVLVVDDEPSMRRMVGMAFEVEGYDVDTADDGATALEMLESGEELPSVIVADIMMPHVDGLRLLGRIRADERWSSIPVLMLSAKARSVDIEVAMRAGASDYVTKPFDFADLIERSAHLMEAVA
jgi:DNA-binding response OmpR family regulator